MSTHPRYHEERCFETFPRPASSEEVEIVAEALDAYCRSLMQRPAESLTDIYNRVTDPAETSPDVRRLRELHVALGEAVRIAYGLG